MTIDLFGLKIKTKGTNEEKTREEYKTIKIYRVTYLELKEALNLQGEIKTLEIDDRTRAMEIKTEQVQEKG